MNKTNIGLNRFKNGNLSAKQMKKICELGSAGSPKSYMFSEEELARFCEELLAEQREMCAEEISYPTNDEYDRIIYASKPQT